MPMSTSVRGMLARVKSDFGFCQPLNFWQVTTGEHFAVVYRRDRFVRFKVVLCRTMICEHPKRTENVSKPFR